MEIRRLEPEDASLARELAGHFGEPAGDPKTIAAWLADERNVAVAAFDEGRPVGLVYGYRLPRMDEQPDALLLYSIDVVEPARRRGIGTRLVAAMRRQTSGLLWLLTNESNEAAMALYRNVGGERPAADDVLWTLAPEGS